MLFIMILFLCLFDIFIIFYIFSIINKSHSTMLCVFFFYHNHFYFGDICVILLSYVGRYHRDDFVMS